MEVDEEDWFKFEVDSTNVKWRTSGAREIILDDLHRGVLTLDEELLSAEQAWECYRNEEAFFLVPFKQFKRQLKAHRQQVLKLVKESAVQYEAFRKDLATQQHFTHYLDGRPIFAASAAHKLLKADIEPRFSEDKIDVVSLQATREEYKSWSPVEFKRRVYQEVRYWKFVAYMEEKRQDLRNRKTEKMEKATAAKKRKTTK